MNKNSLGNKLKGNMKLKLIIGGSLFLVFIFLVSILYTVIITPIFEGYTIFFGISKEDLTTEKYADKDLQELNSKLFDTSCYSLSENWFTAHWSELKDKLTPGINSNCELIELVKLKVIQSQKKYSNYGLKLSPGLVVSTIVNTFGSQFIGEDTVDASEPINMLTAIVESNILTEEDIDDIIDGMIFRSKFWYYICDSTTCTVYDDSGEETQGTGKQCKKKLYYDAYFSQEKFEIFLRYGKEVADSYQAAYNHNEAIKYTCDGCYEEFGGDTSDLVTFDLNKYLVKANPKTSTNDNISIKISQNEYDVFSEETNSINDYLTSNLKEEYNIDTGKSYNYKDGFIYNKFPGFKATGYVQSEIYTPKDIEIDVELIIDYADTINTLFALDNIKFGSQNHQNINLKVIPGINECPASESCNCSNGNLSPTPGIPIMTGEYANSAVCSYLPINSETMIRLRSVIGSPYDYNRTFPGGATLDEETGLYYANNPITLKRYIIGVAIAENGSAPIEALKIQMLAAQTYLFNALERGGIQTNSNGELVVKDWSEQFQVYHEYKTIKYYDNNSGDRRQDYEEAYEAIKNQLVINSQTGKTIFAEFGKEWQKARNAQANSGMLYTDMLTSSEVLNYYKENPNKKNWLYGVLKTCDPISGTQAGTFVPDEGTTTIYSTNATYKNKSQTLGIFGYITYYQPDPNKREVKADPRWEMSNIVKVKKDCGNGLNIYWRVHKLAKTAFEKAAEGICQITTTGIDGITISPSDISFDGAFYPRKVTKNLDSTNLSTHSLGIAIDLNSEYNAVVDGKSYGYVYSREISNYEAFVAAIGTESDPRNINYILWTKVFRELGFKWGGNYGRFGNDGVYDGMHFEIDWRQTK